MKKFLVGFISGIAICSMVTVLADYIINPNPYKIIVDGTEAAIEGYNINDSSYFKLRDIGQATGFDVDFKDNVIVIDTKESDVVEDSQNADIETTEIDGVKYVTTTNIFEKLKDSIYSMNFSVSDKTIWIYNKNTGAKILSDIPFISNNDGLVYVPYDYYLENIAPLLQN